MTVNSVEDRKKDGTINQTVTYQPTRKFKRLVSIWTEEGSKLGMELEQIGDCQI